MDGAKKDGSIWYTAPRAEAPRDEITRNGTLSAESRIVEPKRGEAHRDETPTNEALRTDAPRHETLRY